MHALASTIDMDDPRTPRRLRIAVVLCTWNRARSLQRTLSSLQGITVPITADVRLFVVDNNSSDDTPAVVRAVSLPLPHTYLFEPTPGLSNARNAGVAAARAAAADFTIFTDDDVSFADTWLTAYARAFAAHPDCVIFGGPIIPAFEAPPAPWMQRNMMAFRGPFGLMDHGSGDRSVGLEHDMPYGANMAFRTDVLGDAPFDPSLGVAPGRRMSGEETELGRRIATQYGREWRYVADARVHHHLTGRIVEPRVLYEHFRSFGHFVARDVPRSDPTRPQLPPKWLLRAYATTWMRRRLWWFTRNVAGPYARLFSEEAALRGQLDMYLTRGAPREEYGR